MKSMQGDRWRHLRGCSSCSPLCFLEKERGCLHPFQDDERPSTANSRNDTLGKVTNEKGTSRSCVQQGQFYSKPSTEDSLSTLLGAVGSPVIRQGPTSAELTLEFVSLFSLPQRTKVPSQNKPGIWKCGVQGQQRAS